MGRVVDRELRRFMDLVRRDHGRFRKRWLVFHGTASPALEGVVRVGGVVPWNVLEKRGIVPPTGEQYFSLAPDSIGRRVVSVTRDPKQAGEYAKLGRTLASAIYEDIGSELRYMRNYLKDVKKKNTAEEWKGFHAYIRQIAGRIVGAYSKRLIKQGKVYPVIVATVSKVPAPAEHFNKFGMTALGEEYLVQIPIHKAYFFVPREFVDHAKQLLSKRHPKYAERVFPIDVLKMVYGKEIL